MSRASETGGRQGLVLAAGLGSRLVNRSTPLGFKPLVAVGGVSLLLRTLQSLEGCCDQVVVVLGYGADVIERTVRDGYRGRLQLNFVLNPRYQLANGLSVLAASSMVGDRFILTMADHILDPRMIALAAQCQPPPGGAALLVDYKVDTIFDMDDATKVVAEDGRVVKIGKQLADYNCIDTGLFVCSRGLLDALQQVADRHGDASLSAGVQLLAARKLMAAVDIGGAQWQDVDTPEMLEHAVHLLAGMQFDGLKN